jgi:transglutaminase-like putative cysteine protease
VPLVAAWATGLAATELAVRARRVLLSYLPPTLLYAGALYVVGPNADPSPVSVVGFVAAAAVGLAVTRRPAERMQPGPAERMQPGRAFPAGVHVAVRARILTAAAGAVAVVVSLTAAVAPLVVARVGAQPVDPRRYVQPPPVDSLDENPLIRISGWALNPEQKLFDVRTTGGTGTAPPRIRLAVLSDYDGITWRVGATYRNAGRVLPPAARAAGGAVDTVTQDITVAGLSGRLLPAVPTPEEITGTRAAYDPGSGTLIRPEGLTPGLRYAVTSARERPDLGLLPAAGVPAGEAVARVLRVGDGAPEQLQRLAEQLSTDNGAPYDRALALETFLAEHYRLAADSPSGHAYPNLRFFLFGPRNGGGQRGTSEQFAAAYAVLGRLMGLPTRVVVGFRAPSGTGPVRAADAYAWPEVLFDDVGWVAFNPLPQPDADIRPVEEDFKPAPEDPTPPPTPESPPTAPTPSAARVAAGGGATGRGGTAVPVVTAGAALLLAAAAVYAGTVALLRTRQRRRRLDEGPPPNRVAGAWREVADALRLAGHPAPVHLSATEVAAHARALPGQPERTASRRRVRPATPAIDELAALVNQAAFAPDATDEAHARRAAADALAYTSALRAARPWWRRIRWALHPGPLHWR